MTAPSPVADTLWDPLAEEERRLAAVWRYDILDTPPDGAFERIRHLAAPIFQVPISIVSVVDRDRIWFKSHHGLDVQEIGRDSVTVRVVDDEGRIHYRGELLRTHRRRHPKRLTDGAIPREG